MRNNAKKANLTIIMLFTWVLFLLVYSLFHNYTITEAIIIKMYTENKSPMKYISTLWNLLFVIPIIVTFHWGYWIVRLNMIKR